MLSVNAFSVTGAEIKERTASRHVKELSDFLVNNGELWLEGKVGSVGDRLPDEVCGSDIGLRRVTERLLRPWYGPRFLGGSSG